VGRLTGVEGGVRWFLGGRRPHHRPPTEHDSAEGSNKRRKVAATDLADSERTISRDADGAYPPLEGHQSQQRRPSHSSFADSLPAYDEYRSPSYEATQQQQQALIPNPASEEPASPGSSWQTRLVLSTSGLSVAMSDESLRSLKYCLGWLRWANEHIGKVILALKSVLHQYDAERNAGAIEGTGAAGQLVVHRDMDRAELNAKILELKKDVLKTLKEVVDIVSKYAGGALPENARVLVRRHLTSLPQRFKLANSRAPVARPGEGGDVEVTDGANRVLVLAKEGLDMMAQVSGVLDGTIVSAEEWCERLGRTRREEREAEKEHLDRHGNMEKPTLPPMTGHLPPFPDMKMG